MCYHTSQQKGIKKIQKEFGLPVRNEELFQQAFQLNGFDKPFLPVLSNLNPGTIDFFRWMLIPSWVQEEKDWKANTLNARSESLFETMAFKNYWQQRCLVICTGFFEPHFPVNAKNSQTYYIQPSQKDFFTLGGVFSLWKNLYTFSIVMIEAKGEMAEIHNDKKRMPLILCGEHAQSWLKKDLAKNEMMDIMAPKSVDNQIRSYRVMDGVFNPKINTNIPEVILPYTSSDAQQGSLF